MATRTVRFDEEAERTLAEIQQCTGLSISSALKLGLMAYRDKLASGGTEANVFEIYQSLDLGPGGYALAPAANKREGMRIALTRKHNR